MPESKTKDTPMIGFEKTDLKINLRFLRLEIRFQRLNLRSMSSIFVFIRSPTYYFNVFFWSELGFLNFSLWTSDFLILDLKLGFYVKFHRRNRILRSGIEFLASKTSNLSFNAFVLKPDHRVKRGLELHSKGS